MYAVIITGGKQYKVAQGDSIYIEKLEIADGEKIVFDQVVMVSDGDKLTVGSPTVAGATVACTVVKTGKQKKIIVYKQKAKKNYRRKQGHRQPYTKVTVDAIQL